MGAWTVYSKWIPFEKREAETKYGRALQRGHIIRASHGPNEETIQIVDYIDPIEDTRRWMLMDERGDEDPGGWTTFSTREAAIADYEKIVRNTAQNGYRYASTDVAGLDMLV